MTITFMVVIGRGLGLWALVALVTVAFAVPVARYSAHSADWVEFDNVGQGVAAGIGAMASLRASRRSAGRTRRAWTRIGLGLGSWTIAEVVWSVTQARTGAPPSTPSICDAFFLAADLFLTVGVVTFAISRRPGQSRMSGMLEWLMISGGMLLAGWALLFGPTVHRSTASFTAQAVNISYPAFDIVILSALLFAVGRRTRVERGSLGLLVAGLACVTLADMSFWFLTTVQRYSGSAISDAGWVAGFLIMAVAAGSGGGSRRWVDDRSPASVAVQALPELTLFVCTTAMLAGRLAGVDVRFDSTFMLLVVGVLAISVLHRLTLVVDNLELTAGLEERVRARTEELTIRERYFRTLVHRSSDVIAVIDADLIIRDVTESVETMFGFGREVVIGKDLNRHAAEFEDLISAMHASPAKPGGVHRAEWSMEVNGEVRFAESTISDLVGDPEINAFVVNTRDVTERAQLEQEIRRQAFHDSLTSLPNRARFHDQVDRAIEAIHSSGELVGVMLIDLDGFKTVNDSLGHQAGDVVLTEVARRLVAHLPPSGMVARLGGDEFAVLLRDLSSTVEATRCAAKLLAAIREDVDIAGQRFAGSASIGIVVSRSSEATVESLIRDADIAMYTCKRSGKDRARLFKTSMREEAEERFHLEAELRGAVDRHEIVLHYQPTIDLKSGVIVGFEALARWEHPRLGLLMPERFIPLAEETGLIVPLGRWVLREAILQAAAWSRSLGDRALSMSINVSARQLRERDLVTDLRSAIAEAGIEPGHVTLELTESMLIADSDDVVEVLGRLYDVGVRLAIDDFGTGYASMSYLRRLPIEILKIDKTFVDGAGRMPDAGEKLLRAILSLGHTMGLSTVAEGIEDAAQVEALVMAGCDVGQGYFFSRPVPADQAWKLVEPAKTELVS